MQALKENTGRIPSGLPVNKKRKKKKMHRAEL